MKRDRNRRIPLASWSLPRAKRNDTAEDHLAICLEMFGPPDERASTENVQPRPRFVNLTLTYCREGLIGVLTMNTRGKWEFAAWLDLTTGLPIGAATAIDMLTPRHLARRRAAGQ